MSVCLSVCLNRTVSQPELDVCIRASLCVCACVCLNCTEVSSILASPRSFGKILRKVREVCRTPKMPRWLLDNVKWCCTLQYFGSSFSPCGKHHQQAAASIPAPCQIGDPAPVPPANALQS